MLHAYNKNSKMFLDNIVSYERILIVD